MKQFFLFATLALCSSAFAQSFSSPEAVEYDAPRQRYIVSNTNTGNLQSVIPGQAPVLFTAAPSGPYGLHAVGDTIYVVDGSGVKAYDLNTATQVLTVALGATFPNGICGDNNDNIYVSDFNGKKIYRFNRFSGQFNVFVANTVSTPNGLVFDEANNRLLVACWGNSAPVRAVSLADSSLSIAFTTTYGSIDGIAMNDSGDIYIATWSDDQIHKYNSSYVEYPSFSITGMGNPADITYSAINDTLAVPSTSNNDVYFFGFVTPVDTIDTIDTIDTTTYIIDLPKEPFTFSLYRRGASLHVKWKDIPSSDVIIDLMSVSGATLQSKRLRNDGKGEDELEIATLPAGVYFVRLIAGQHAVMRKFSKD